MTWMRPCRLAFVLLVVVSGTACADSPPAPTPTGQTPPAAELCAGMPGTTCAGTNGWIQYEVGDLPVVVTVPHGGSVAPASVPDRASGTFATDRNTIELAEAIADAFRRAGGGAPHVVVSHLRRTKLDPNRDLAEAAQGQPDMVRAWTEYHGFIDLAIDAVQARHGRGIFVDLHGHAHAVDRIEWGYLLAASTLDQSDAALDGGPAGGMSSLSLLLGTTPAAFSEVLRGATSLGGLLEPAMPSVPSPSAPSPGGAEYFTGGYTTARHAQRLPGVQLEAHFPGLRDTAGNRAAFAAAFVEALRTFMATHLSLAAPVGPVGVAP